MMKAYSIFVKVVVVALLFAIVAASMYGCEKKPIVLRIWQTETDPTTVNVLEAAARSFQREHENVTVEIESIAWGSLSQRLLTALVSGHPPDISHLQPFMLQSLADKGRLLELDDVIDSIGRDDIYPNIREMHKIGGHYYGIAHSFNTSQWGYRRDIAASKGVDVDTIVNWSQFIGALAQCTDTAMYGAILPGGDPLFIDFLLAQFVACNGGCLFHENGRPAFTEEPVIEALQFFYDIAKYCPPDWVSTKYIDQFRPEISGKVVFIPFTGYRASKQFELDAPANMANPDYFSVMTPPIGPRGDSSTHYSGWDGEPFVIFRDSRNVTIAKEFLEYFYKSQYYYDYCASVPGHLSPIFKSMNEGGAYDTLNSVKQWTPWREMMMNQIQADKILPFLISAKHELKLGFLLEIQNQRILSRMVLDVTRDGISPREAAEIARTKAEKLITDLGYKKW
ncbi:MAG: extracellular solute-binding protein [Candidatus Zixiibacteriota bacterium]